VQVKTRDWPGSVETESLKSFPAPPNCRKWCTDGGTDSAHPTCRNYGYAFIAAPGAARVVEAVTMAFIRRRPSSEGRYSHQVLESFRAHGKTRKRTLLC
jgi:hypothetical protein